MGVPGKLFGILMLLLHETCQQQTFNDEKKLVLPDNYNIGWMQTLDDRKLISQITIPGTHETMALHGGPAAKCQAWSLEDQLKAGIRYLDLRVSGKNMKVVHGPISQHTSFDNTFNTVKNFLSRYQTETVVVRVKHNGKVPDNYISRLKNDPDSWVSDTIPTIQQVRGKIVFAQKNNFKLGIPLSETDKHGDYKVGLNVEKKKDKISAHLNEALIKCQNNEVVLNYSSGTGWPWLLLHRTPKNVAKSINPWLYDELKANFEQNSNRCFGIITMDFPGFDLIQMIIRFNT